MIFRCKCGTIFGEGVYKYELEANKFTVHAPVVGKLKQYEIEYSNDGSVYRHYLLNTLNELNLEYINGKYRYVKPYETYLKLIKANKIKVLKVATIDEFVKDNFLDEEIDKCKSYETFDEYIPNHAYKISKKGKKVVVIGGNNRVKVDNKQNKLIILDTKIDSDGSFCYKYTIHYEKIKSEPIEPKVDVSEEYIILKCPTCGEEVARIKRTIKAGHIVNLNLEEQY